MKLTKLFLLLTSISALVISSDRSASAAGSTPANLNVSATVVKACSIRTLAVAFSSYDPSSSSANDTGQGTVIIRCTQNTPSTIGLGFGQNPSGTQRSMKETTSGVGNLLQYGLFSDSTRLTAWGDGTAGSSVFTPPTKSDNAEYSYGVFGRIPALQNVPDYTYNDIVVATVNF
jgi:spore coat protein U-like protein